MNFDYTQPSNMLTVLSDSSIARIHESSLRILEKLGVKVLNPGLVSTLSRLGAEVENGSEVVRLPRELVEHALKCAPSSFTMYDKCGGEYRIGGTGKDKHMGIYGNALQVLDYRSQKLRESVLRDAEEFIRVADSFPEVGWVSPPCHPHDVPHALANLEVARVVLSESKKMVLPCPHDLRDFEDWVAMAEIASDDGVPADRTQAYGLSTTSPLLLDPETSRMLAYAAQKNLPVITTSCPIAGGTSPLTLAGTIVLQNAENLFMLAVVQMLNEGCPVVIGGAAGAMDMRSGRVSYGCAERSLMLNANMQLAHFYGIPGYSPSGSVDSCESDIQIGVEKTLIYLSRLLSHATFLVNMGAVTNGTAISLEQLAIDRDVILFLKRFVEGVKLDDETITEEAIFRVGPGGDYMMDDHTLRHMKDGEYCYSELFNRQGDRGKRMLDRSHDQVRAILESHTSTVSDTVRGKLDSYVRDRKRDTDPVGVSSIQQGE